MTRPTADERWTDVQQTAGMSELVVHKHELHAEVNDLQLAFGAQVLHVAEQQPGRVQLWEVHVPTERRTRVRRFRVVGAGHPFPDGGEHVGTFLAAGGTYVFHVFEETP